MASQLSLRISSQLDKKGFDDFKRESKGLVDNIRQANTSTQNLAESFSNLGSILVGVFAASGIKAFVAAALETDRSVAIIAGRFKALGDAGITSAQDVEALTASLARTSQFSQTELLAALNATLRTAKSSGEAFNVLATAQTLAAATGKEVATAAFAITRAQQGGTRQLQIITGLSSARIKQLNDEGKLLDVINAKFKDAAEAAGSTLAGELKKLGNRFTEIGESIGHQLLPFLQFAIDTLKAIPTPLITAATATLAFLVATKGIASALAVLGIGSTTASKSVSALGVSAVGTAAQMSVLKTAVTQTTVEVERYGVAIGSRGVQTGGFKAALSGIGAAIPGLALTGGIAAIELFVASYQAGTDKINEATAAMNLKFSGVPEALKDNLKALGSLEQQSQGAKNAIALLNEQLDKLLAQGISGDRNRIARQTAERDRLVAESRQIQEQIDFRKKLEAEGTKEEEKRFRELTQAKDTIRATDLSRDIAFLTQELEDDKIQGEERKVRQLKRQNDLIEIHQLGLAQIIKAHEDANRKLTLLEQAVAAIRPTEVSKLASDEQDKIINSELRLRNRKLEVAKTEKEDAIRKAKEEFENSFKTAQDREGLEKKISDAIKDERGKQLTIHQDFEGKIKDFEFKGRKDLREEERRKVDELARQQERRIDQEETLKQATKKRLGLLEEQRIPAVVEIKTVEFSGNLTQQITDEFRKKLGDNFIIIKVKEPVTAIAPSGKH